MDVKYDQKVHPIGAVERRTGLSPHVIRKWEERYAAVVPERNENGRRLYSEKDIERLNLLSRAAATGRSIGQLTDLSDETLESYISADIRSANQVSETVAVRKGQSNDSSRLFGLSRADTDYIDTAVHQYLQAAARYDERELSAILDTALSQLGQYPVIDLLIPRILRAIGDVWQAGSLRIGQEHLATLRIEIFLLRLLDANELPNSAPRAVSAVLKEQTHTIGALSAAVVCRSAGWQTLFLGGGTPAEEITGAVRHTKAQVLLLSLSYPYRTETLHRELSLLKSSLPEDTAVIAGGQLAHSYTETYQHSGLQVIATFSELRQKMREIAQN